MNKRNTLRSKLFELLHVVVELVYPTTCVFCGKIEVKGICASCRNSLVYVEEPRCKKCGKSIRYEEDEYCMDCNRETFAYETGRSIWVHKEPVNSSIYQFKYHNRRIYAKAYVKELVQIHRATIDSWKIHTIIPVPIHKIRRRKRGYNQAEVLADYLGVELEISVDKGIVRRIKHTKPQKNIEKKNRKKNLENAFTVTKEWVGSGNVLLIDDIYTTGSTIHAIAKVLKEAGVDKVYFLTISIGQGF